MVVTRPKSPEHIQAQIADYVGENLTGMQAAARRRKIVNRLGELSHLPVGSVLPEDQAEYQSYLQYLRGVKPEQRQMMRDRAAYVTEYARFSDAIAVLRRQMLTSENYRDDPDFIGEGSYSRVFRLQTGDTAYAVRFPNHPHDFSEINAHLDAEVRGSGIPGLEKVVAASYEDGVTISELVTGEVVGGMTEDQVSTISESHIYQLIETIRQGTERGISFDLHAGNLLYDTDRGFTVIDYFVIPDTDILTDDDRDTYWSAAYSAYEFFESVADGKAVLLEKLAAILREHPEIRGAAFTLEQIADADV